MDSTIGKTLNGRYRVTGDIGAGAMGVVYRADDQKIGGEVAIKVLPPALARDPQYLARFEREARALRDLNHPNIVTFIDSFEEESNYYLVMEYMPGGNLYDLLQRQGALPVDDARQIAIDISDALIRAHRLDITHRDLKPENILFDADGNPRLADFGVAGTTAEEGGTRLTGTGTQMGTPYYMSPEAWQGQQQDAQSDIWSLGVVLYEMLSGQLPFRGETAIAVMRQVLQNPTPDIRQLRDDIPEGLYQIIRKALAKDSAQRYRNVRDISGDLERGEPAVPLRGSGMASDSSRRGGLLVGGLVIVLVIVAAVIGIFVLGGGDDGQVAEQPIATDTPEAKASPTDTPTPDSQPPTQSPREIAQATLDQEGTIAAEFTAIAAENEQTLAVAQTQTATVWTATPTSTATDTVTPTPSPTLTPPPTATLDPVDAPIAIFSDEGVPLYGSPNLDATILSTVSAEFAATLPILAVSEDGNFYQVQFQAQTGWIDADSVDVQGDLGTLTGEPAPEVAAAETGQVIFAEDFENGQTGGWFRLVNAPLGEWEIITEEDGNTAFRGTTSPGSCPVPAIGSPDLRNYRLNLRVKFIEGGALEIFVRAQDFDNYYTLILENGRDFAVVAKKDTREWSTISEGVFAHNAGDWNDVQIEVIDNTILASVNGESFPPLDVEPFGNIFETGQAGVVFCPTQDGNPTTVLLDDVQLTALDAFAPPLEYVRGEVLFEDDFEDGQASGWFRVGDAPLGNWGVVTEDDGNIAFRGTNDPGSCATTVVGSPDWRNYAVNLRFKFTEGDAASFIFRAQDFDNHYAVNVGPEPEPIRIARKSTSRWLDYSDGIFILDTSAWNTLHVNVVDSIINVAINGASFPPIDTQAFGATLDTGYPGLIICPTTNGGSTTLLVDDFEITSLEITSLEIAPPEDGTGAASLEPVSQNADWTPVVQTFNGTEMALVPPGCFTMGSANGDNDEQPVHEQCIDEPFWIDRYEVTTSQFENNGGEAQRAPARAVNNENLPRTHITWHEARNYCEQLGGRLPTEAEWEYAARGPDSLVFPWGDVFIAENANCGVCTDSTGQLEGVGGWPGGESWVGAFNMSDNATEWVNSMYQDYPYVAGDGREDMRQEDANRVFRGGSFGFGVENIRAADRSFDTANYASRAIGVRCARDYSVAGISAPFVDSPYQEGAVLFVDDFEDGEAQNWDAGTHPETPAPRQFWTVEQEPSGNWILVGNNDGSVEEIIALPQVDEWENYALEFRFNMSSASTIDNRREPVSTFFRVNFDCHYWLGLAGGTLDREGFQGNACDFAMLAEPFQFPGDLTLDTWHWVRVEAFDNTITYYLDGQQIFTVTDPEPSLTGRFQVSTDHTTAFDDFRVVELLAP